MSRFVDVDRQARVSSGMTFVTAGMGLFEPEMQPRVTEGVPVDRSRCSRQEDVSRFVGARRRRTGQRVAKNTGSVSK